MDLAQIAIDHLGPALAEVGYARTVKVRWKNGGTLSVKFVNDSADEMTCKPNVEVYLSDLYPNERGECFLCVWNWIGMPGPVKAVAEHLTRKGFAARATSHRKTCGVRFKFNPWDHEKEWTSTEGDAK